MGVPAVSATAVIERYYALFNQRLFEDMAALFADDAVVEHLPLSARHGGTESCVDFARKWVSAFPDAAVRVEDVRSRDPLTHEIALVATGTHRGALDLGGWVFKPTGAHTTLRLREILEIREGRITFASLSLDIQEIVEQLAKIDYTQLLERIARIRQLGEQLAAVQHDQIRAREVADRLGIELDAARHTVRPYFKT